MRLGKHAGAGSRVEGGGDTSSMQYYCMGQDIIQCRISGGVGENKLISESAALKKAWTEHPRLQSTVWQAFGVPLIK